ncbi:MAG: carbohydrate binding family 9 domain-containing protein [Saprospiraceae bacterium]|nr:carbohydrate binding family 9 domain-containing protein [Saprospiraceae bacterium]
MKIKTHIIFSFLILLLCLSTGISQKNEPNVSIRKANGKIKLDGIHDEADWQTAQVASNFRMNFPYDTASSPWQTEARFCFDEKKLYVAIRCYQLQTDYTVQSLKRDFGPGTTDVINVEIDAYRDGLNGLVFSVSPFNVQREGSINEGNDLDLNWDNKWQSEVKNYNDYWDVEIAIPFKTLRYKLSNDSKLNEWSINFVRTKIKNFETNTWAPVPGVYHPLTLSFAGKLIWLDPPPNPGLNISIIPFVASGLAQNSIRNTDLRKTSDDYNFTRSIGFDAKISVTPALNLDLTVNPDFSQVEVDDQIANVSRFELFFPEKRQFFIENQDLFARFGFPSSRPFFSRRLGLVFNSVTKQNDIVPIIAGARLSGKLNNNLRLGVLNVTSNSKKFSEEKKSPTNNVSVVTLQQKIFGRSTIAGIFVNQLNNLNSLNETQRKGFNTYNSVAGLEYNLFSKNNQWIGETYFHRSFSPDKNKRGNSYAAFLSYNPNNFSVRFGTLSVDSFFTADAGFIPRSAYRFLISGAEYYFWTPKSKKIRRINVGISSEQNTDLQWNNLDYFINPFVSVEFNSQASIGIGSNIQYTYLYEPFDPTNGLIEEGEQELPVGPYYFNQFSMEAFTGTSNNLNAYGELNIGQFFKGHITNISGNVSYRIQPIGLISMEFDYYKIDQDKPYPSASFILIGPKAEISFSRSVFLSSFFQYNTQINNFNINTRFQWRFAPVSDLYIVYTDNSFAQEIQPNIHFLSNKNRAIVAKAVYWFN